MSIIINYIRLKRQLNLTKYELCISNMSVEHLYKGIAALTADEFDLAQADLAEFEDMYIPMHFSSACGFLADADSVSDWDLATSAAAEFTTQAADGAFKPETTPSLRHWLYVNSLLDSCGLIWDMIGVHPKRNE